MNQSVPLDAGTAIIGLLAVMDQVRNAISHLQRSEYNDVLSNLEGDIDDMYIPVGVMKSILDRIGQGGSDRMGLIEVDSVVAILTDALLMFSELQQALRPDYQSLDLVNLQRLNGILGQQRTTVKTLLKVFFSDPDDESTSARQLKAHINRLLGENKNLRARLRQLENQDQADSIIADSLITGADTVVPEFTSTTAPGQSSTERKIMPWLEAEFEQRLNESRVYRRVQLYSSDISFTTSDVRTHAWSIFSGISLSQISAISVIAIPLYTEELLNMEWYQSIASPNTVMVWWRNIHLGIRIGTFDVQISAPDVVPMLQEQIAARINIPVVRQDLRSLDGKILLSSNENAEEFSSCVAAGLTLSVASPKEISVRVTSATSSFRATTLLLSENATASDLYAKLKRKRDLGDFLFYDRQFLKPEQILFQMAQPYENHLSLKLLATHYVDEKRVLTPQSAVFLRLKRNVDLSHAISDMKFHMAITWLNGESTDHLYLVHLGLVQTRTLIVDEIDMQDVGSNLTETLLLFGSFPGLSFTEKEARRISLSLDEIRAEKCDHCASCYRHSSLHVCITIHMSHKGNCKEMCAKMETSARLTSLLQPPQTPPIVILSRSSATVASFSSMPNKIYLN